MRSVPPVLRWAGHGAPPDQHVDLYEAVKYDTRLHGTRFIITEFAAATLGSGLLGGFEVFRLDRTLPTVLTGLWFLGVSLNSLAVVALARHATRHGMAAQLGERRLQLSAMALIGLLLVPAAIAIFTARRWATGALTRRPAVDRPRTEQN